MTNKILIADDEVGLTSIMVDTLAKLPKDLNAKVMTVNRGTDVLPTIEANPDTQIVFLDIVFPNEPEDGMAILKKIRTRFPDVKVIMLTAASTPEKMADALMEYKAFEYIRKPIEFKILLYMTEGILRGRYKAFTEGGSVSF